ncbi:MAG: DUF4430 domain-containing protein, partial [Solirubrobacterales bacterium]|nr:DUF4430 domain-containing protein [Solirubrobacterales bacterium]
MSRRRGTAVAIALLLAALAAAGCGLGSGEGRGDVALTVTHDYGAEPVLERSVGGIAESDTVIRVLDRNTEISTRYGGAFVHSIEGVAGGQREGRPHHWFFYVNGLWSPVGAAEYALRGGEAIWWDYRDWSVGTRVAAVVGSWPQPFAGGYEGGLHATAVECLGGGAACGVVRRRLRDAGASLTAGSPRGAIRVLVGPWARLRGDRDAALIEDGAQVSGVFAEFVRRGRGFVLWGLDEGGEPARAFGPDAGLIAATRRFDAPPVWLVTG